MTNITVKKQTEQGSKNWGVFINDRLVEGGFFSRDNAQQCADDWASEIVAEQSVYEEMAAFEERFLTS